MGDGLSELLGSALPLQPAPIRRHARARPHRVLRSSIEAATRLAGDKAGTLRMLVADLARGVPRGPPREPPTVRRGRAPAAKTAALPPAHDMMSKPR